MIAERYREPDKTKIKKECKILDYAMTASKYGAVFGVLTVQLQKKLTSYPFSRRSSAK